MGIVSSSTIFQSTLPRRERRGLIFVGAMLLTFQSTLPRRERPRAYPCLCRDGAFQSTLPRRERRLTSSRSQSLKNFNPRSREGSDLLARAELVKRDVISIHAPAKGATGKFAFTLQQVAISIHAPAKGATLRLISRSRRIDHFNPRSREGSDPLRRRFLQQHWHFNPRSREGSD